MHLFGIQSHTHVLVAWLRFGLRISDRNVNSPYYNRSCLLMLMCWKLSMHLSVHWCCCVCYTGVRHPDVVCDSCGQSGIAGVRWMCTKCKDFDLCTPCYNSGKHNHDHPFTRFITANSKVSGVIFSFEAGGNVLKLGAVLSPGIHPIGWASWLRLYDISGVSLWPFSLKLSTPLPRLETPWEGVWFNDKWCKLWKYRWIQTYLLLLSL